MAYIDLVIKIPEEEYRWIKKSDITVFADVASKECMLNAIKNGTPLDKLRAEIIDMGAYEQEVNGKTEFLKGIDYCLNVIDKYKAESEG